MKKNIISLIFLIIVIAITYVVIKESHNINSDQFSQIIEDTTPNNQDRFHLKDSGNIKYANDQIQRSIRNVNKVDSPKNKKVNTHKINDSKSSAKKRKVNKKNIAPNFKEAQEQINRYIQDPYLHYVPVDRIESARLIQQQLVSQKFRNNDMKSNGIPNISWQERGPNNIGGRTKAILIDNQDASNGYKKVWAGGVSGGLWFTNDITANQITWNKVNDFMDNLAINAIAQNPINAKEIYIGTGDVYAFGIQGNGVYKTIDGGVTWNKLSSTSNFRYINDIAIDSSGNVYLGMGYSSMNLAKSSDGGATWREVGIPYSNPSAGEINDVRNIRIASNKDIYVSCYNSAGNGRIFVSDYSIQKANTGERGTWLNITPSLNGSIDSSTSNKVWQMAKIASSQSSPNILYTALQGATADSCASIQVYDRLSKTWKQRTVPGFKVGSGYENIAGSQAWYDLELDVDPLDPATLYVTGLNGARSLDSGKTWTGMFHWYGASYIASNGKYYNYPSVHADHHFISYFPKSSQKLLIGNDGGIYYTDSAKLNRGDSVKPKFIPRNTNFNITQFYSTAIHPKIQNFIIGGTQDNGTLLLQNPGVNNAFYVTGGDGGWCFIDQTADTIMGATYIRNNYYISTDAGNNYKNVVLDGGDFINHFEYDPKIRAIYANTKINYYLRWKNIDKKVSDTAYVQVSAFNGGNVASVAVSPITANKVFFGLTNGTVVMVDNADINLSKTGKVIFKEPANKQVYISNICLDNADSNHIIISISNYGVKHIYESKNALTASPIWSAIDGNYPDIPVWWIMIDPRDNAGLFIATELGVWSTSKSNGSSTVWDPTNNGLANTRVFMLKLRSKDNLLVAATYGRGIFSTNLITGSTPASPIVTNLTYCMGDIAKPLTALAPAGSTLLWYSSASGGTGSAIAPTPTTSSAGQFKYYVSSVNASNIESTFRSELTVTVNALPIKPIISWNSSQLSTASGLSSYQWLLGGTAVPGATNNTYTPTAVGAYTVRVSNTAGCSNLSDPYTLVVTAITPVFISGTSVKVYPNPASTEAVIAFDQTPVTNVQIMLINSNGIVVKSMITKQKINKFSVYDLSKGMYYVEFKNGKQTGTIQLIIQ